MRNPFALLVVAVLSLAAPNRSFADRTDAEATTALQSNSDRRLEIAREIVRLSNFQGVERAVLERDQEAYVFVLQKKLGLSREDAQRVFDRDVRAALDTRYGELVDALAEIYAAHYTTSELEQVAGVWRSAVGRRVAAETPSVTLESAKALKDWRLSVLRNVIADHAVSTEPSSTPRAK